MSTRLAKQLIYGTFYIVILALIVWGIYGLFIKTPVSCFDGKQDQGEQGIDCGGPCATACTANAQAISVVSVNAFVSSPGQDTFLAQIANINPGLAAQSFDYSFNLYDASNTLLESVPGQSFLYDKEVKYLLLANQAVPATLDHINLTITNIDWVGATAFGAAPQLALQAVSTAVGSSTAVASGQITDNDTATLGNVVIVAVFKDASGHPIGASQTELTSLAPGQTQTFSISYPAVYGIDPSETDVEADALRN